MDTTGENKDRQARSIQLSSEAELATYKLSTYLSDHPGNFNKETRELAQAALNYLRATTTALRNPR